MNAHNISVNGLLVENDIAIFRSAAIACAIGLGISAYFATIKFILPEELFFTAPTQLGDKVTVKIVPDKPKIKEVTPRNISKRPVTKTGSSGVKSTARGNPKAIRATSVLAILQARSNKMNQNAYTQMNATIHQDINKVLASGAKILTAGKVAIGTRQGKASGDWNGFVGDGGTDGIEGMLSSLMGGPGEIAGSKVIKGKWNLTNPGEISVPEGNGGRSVTEIMQVVKARTPGLRHIYNKFLKLHPGMAGKVTLQFTILAGGDVVECNIRNSTTQISEFDEEIREAVQRWNFKIIKSGNTTVAMPFNFSE